MSSRFLINNIIDRSYLESNPVMYTGLPLENVKLLSKSLVARSGITSSIEITGVFPGISNVSSFVLCGHNFLAGTEYRLQLYDNVEKDINTLVYDSSTKLVTSVEAYVPGSDKQFTLPIWFDTVEAVTFTLNLSDNPLGYFQVYRMFAGEYIELSVGISYGHSVYWKEDTHQYRTDLGTLRSDKIKPSKVIEFSLDTTSELDRSMFQRALSSVGMKKEFFIDLFPCAENPQPKNLDYRGVVKLVKVPKFTEFINNIYRSTYEVEEV